jgi:Haemolymph juvenile hormone binding protein (JHBP)
LEIDYAVLNHGGNNSRFNLKSTFKDVKIHGLSTSKLNRTSINLDKFKIKSDIYTERLEMVGNYDMKGQVVFLPLEGRGKANISMHKLTSRHELFGEYYTKPDGETYINITDYKIKFKPKRVVFSFENLFNGDKNLGRTMNKFMNDNW